MTKHNKEHEEFVARMVAEFNQPETERVARLLLRHAKTHGRLETMSCNGHPAQGSPTMPIARINFLQDQWDRWIAKREAQVERRMRQLAESIGATISFEGDPRGYTVKVMLPSGRYNTMGGSESGWGVPQ